MNDNAPKPGEHGFQKTHGLRAAPEYQVWNGMKQRCTNPNNKRYKHYGGRGIKVCDRWAASFAAFIEDMGHRPSPRHTIDRINNDGNYEPGNCRWASPIEQMNNQSKTVRVLVAGEIKTLREIAEDAEVPLSCIQSRHQIGYTGEKLTHKGYIRKPAKIQDT